MHQILKAFLTALAITTVVTPAAIKIAPKIGAMDIPKDNRRMHKEPLPRFGGIAMFLGIFISYLIYVPMDTQTMGLLVGMILMFLLGLVDDFKNLRPKLKFAGQIVCAAVVWFYTIRINGMANFFPFGPAYISFPDWLSACVTIFWIVGIVNAVNLVDGLDGLAAGITCIACLSVAYTANYTGRPETTLMMLVIAGATIGFLLYNFNPAKIIMGDAGSLLLGFLLATVPLIGVTPTKSVTLFSVVVPVFILALPIFDTSYAIVRRAVNHRPIMQADKGHLHHRIMALGIGQRRTVLALYSISAIMGVAGIMWTVKFKFEALILAVIAGTLIVTFLGVGFKETRSEEPSAETAETDPAGTDPKTTETESAETDPKTTETESAETDPKTAETKSAGTDPETEENKNA